MLCSKQAYSLRANCPGRIINWMLWLPLAHADFMYICSFFVFFLIFSVNHSTTVSVKKNKTKQKHCPWNQHSLIMFMVFLPCFQCATGTGDFKL